ncbi:MAG: T9SS type A sorting domain-containing protein [Bacteroidetes bacterium]|nr:T9SS type A sorting domain-containing protein [Bacteroidota bacterium]MBU1719983.1 T9SS type A sorting domain-containing protein [Bacteroidota bacterium]
MRAAVFSLVFIWFQLSGGAQPIINAGDMPNVDDTFRISIDNSIGAVDLDLTGSGYTWYFSFLESDEQTVDTFVNVLSTPVAYNIVFNNPLDPEHRATIAAMGEDRSPPSGGQITITEVYNFFKEDALQYSQVGFAAKVNDVPTPLKYDNPEKIYKFPMTYDDRDTSLSKYSISIPTFGYFGESRYRINHVDGWGTLITPFGTFDAYRIKSEIWINDTIFYDAYGFGANLPERTEVEYRWIADNMGVPVLEITERGSGHQARYQDSLQIFTELSKIGNSEFLQIFPNPSFSDTKISFNLRNTENQPVTITNLAGEVVFSTTASKGLNSLVFPEEAGTGIFLLHIRGYNPAKIFRIE